MKKDRVPFSYRMAQMMQGRYGVDAMSRFLLVLAVVIMVVSLFFRRIPTIYVLLYFVSMAAMVYMYIRTFSRNIEKRYQQNQKYLAMQNKVTGFFRIKKKHMVDRKTHHIYACPNCKQKVRVPKGRGKIEITCPKCGNRFEKRS